MFIHEELDTPIQVVLAERGVEIYYKDIRESGSRDEKEKMISSFKNKNRKRLFDLSKDVLIRLSVFRVDEAEYEFVWNNHHIILDGWSTMILVSDYFEIYNSLRESGGYRLPPVKSYGTYIKWLQNRDQNRMRHYWKDYLAGYEIPAALPAKRKAVRPGNGYQPGEVEYVMSPGKISNLKKFSTANQVTLNIIFQTIWAIILGMYNEKQDVVFGIVVSGRPAEIEGIETIVGLFINTIPCRICYEGQTKFIDLLHQVRDDAVKTEPYHFLTLAEIQAQSDLKQDLLNHIFVFENYPSASLPGHEKIQVHEEFAEFSGYDFNVLIIPGELFKIKIGYNANLFNKKSIEKVTGHFDCLVDQILENGDSRIKDLQISSNIIEVDTNIIQKEDGDFKF